MCLALLRPDGGSNIPNAVIDTAFTRHPDGFGLVHREDGRLVIERYAPNERKAFRAALKRVDKAGAEYAAHWRYATHGPTDRDHAHPYTYDDPVEGTVAILHNGTINIATEKHESDTEVFVRDVLAHLPTAWWRVPALRYLVSQSIDWSKLVVMTAQETVVINEARGEWDGGIWYSSDHRPSKWITGKYTPKVPSSHGDAKRALVPVVTPESAYLPDKCEPGSWPILRHEGHALQTLAPMSMSKDKRYRHAVKCTQCGTLGDVYVADGFPYVDMAHKDAAEPTFAGSDDLPWH